MPISLAIQAPNRSPITSFRESCSSGATRHQRAYRPDPREPDGRRLREVGPRQDLAPQCGRSPRLQDDRYLPLFVRVNDVERGPFASVLDGIRSEAERQRVEYVPGAAGSLWSFFKTVEFWQGDLLLTPVLILDQFEELFTLQPEGRGSRFSMSSVISSAVFARLRPQTPIVPWAKSRRLYASFYLSARTSLGSSKKHRTTSHRSLITASAWHP